MFWRFPSFPETELGRRRLVRLAQSVILVAIVVYLIVSTVVLLSLSDRNHELLREQKRSSEYHADQAAQAQIRTRAAIEDISEEIRRQLNNHDDRIKELLKNIRFEVNELPDGDAQIVVRTVPGPTVTATPRTPRCERLPNGRCKS